MNGHWNTFACDAETNIAGQTFDTSTLMSASIAMITRNAAAERGTFGRALGSECAVLTRAGSSVRSECTTRRHRDRGIE